MPLWDEPSTESEARGWLRVWLGRREVLAEELVRPAASSQVPTKVEHVDALQRLAANPIAANLPIEPNLEVSREHTTQLPWCEKMDVVAAVIDGKMADEIVRRAKNQLAASTEHGSERSHEILVISHMLNYLKTGDEVEDSACKRHALLRHREVDLGEAQVGSNISMSRVVYGNRRVVDRENTLCDTRQQSCSVTLPRPDIEDTLMRDKRKRELIPRQMPGEQSSRTPRDSPLFFEDVV